MEMADIKFCEWFDNQKLRDDLRSIFEDLFCAALSFELEVTRNLIKIQHSRI